MPLSSSFAAPEAIAAAPDAMVDAAVLTFASLFVALDVSTNYY